MALVEKLLSEPMKIDVDNNVTKGVIKSKKFRFWMITEIAEMVRQLARQRLLNAFHI